MEITRNLNNNSALKPSVLAPASKKPTLSFRAKVMRRMERERVMRGDLTFAREAERLLYDRFVREIFGMI